jgi:hypothetical protein
MIVIGFAGRAGSGKTAAAQHLTTRRAFIRVRFADPLKSMLREGFGLDVRELDGDLKGEPCAALGGVTPRRAMQTLGTEWGRQMVHPDLWTMAWQGAVGRMRHAFGDGLCVVADDVRFPNEVATIRSLGGRVVWIARSGPANQDLHSSEHSIDITSVDHMILNNGSLDQMYSQIDRILPRQATNEVPDVA